MVAGPRILLIGAPGSGKGTQAVRLASELGARHIAAGDVLRAEVASGSADGATLQGYLRSGDLVPDDLVLRLLWQRIVAAAGSSGYVLDGFPRNLSQAEVAEQRGARDGVTPHVVVCLDVDEAALVERMVGRAATEGRPDDTEPVIRHRLDVFGEQTRPVVARYRERGLLVSVDATGTVDEVHQRVLAAVSPRLPGRHDPAG